MRQGALMMEFELKETLKGDQHHEQQNEFRSIIKMCCVMRLLIWWLFKKIFFLKSEDIYCATFPAVSFLLETGSYYAGHHGTVPSVGTNYLMGQSSVYRAPL